MASSMDARHAGFWLRAAAAIVDLMFLGVLLSIFVSFLAVTKRISTAFLELHPGESPSAVISAFGKSSLLFMLCFFVVSGWLYFAFLESSIWQGTIGKKLFGLYVTDTGGSRASFSRASGRFLGGRLLVHVPYCGIPYFVLDCICAGLTSKKQALHDLFAGCLVLKRNNSLQTGL